MIETGKVHAPTSESADVLWNELQPWLHEQGVLEPTILVQSWKQFHTMLINTNATHNLTRIVSLEDALLKHYKDSYLTFTTALDLLQGSKPASILDFGCGGGFPGIPIALAHPGLELVAVDARRKKVEFVARAMHRLNLLGEAVHAHLNARESRAFASKRGRVDWSLARAVAALPELIRTLSPLSRKAMVFSKGPALQEAELEEAQALARKAGFIRFLQRSLSLGDEKNRLRRRILVFAR